MYPLFGLRGGGCQSLEDNMSPKKLNFFLAPTLTEIAIFFSCRTTKSCEGWNKTLLTTKNKNTFFS